MASNPLDDPLSDPTRAGSTGPDPTLAPAGGFVTRPTLPTPPTSSVEPSTQPLIPPMQPLPSQPASPWARPDTPAYLPPPPYPPGVVPSYPPPAQPTYQAPGANQPGWPAYPPSYPYPTQPLYPTPGPATTRSPRGSLFFMVAGLVLLAVVAIGVGALVGHRNSGTPTDSLSDPGTDPFAGNNPFGIDPFGSSAPFPLGAGSADGAQVAPGDRTDRLPLGQTVHLTNGASAWTVTITAASWASSCPAFTVVGGSELEVTAVVKVTQGTVTISPLDFSYTDPAGEPGLPLLLVNCGSGVSQSATVTARNQQSVTVIIDVLGQRGGVIGYGGTLSSVATWVAPA